MIILDAKTDYSFMRGFGSPAQWLQRCKQADISVLGIADYCSTWGHTPFQKAFKGSGVKLIYGVQLPVVLQLDKDPRHSLVTLLATDDVKPLYDLVTLAETQTYYRPRVTWKQVREFPGIVILNYVTPQNMRAAQATNAFLGLSPELPQHMLTLEHPRVPAYGPRFPSAELRQGYGLVQAISEGHRFGEVDVDALHALRRGELARVIPDLTPIDIETLAVIASQCTADIPKGALIVPKERTDKLGDLERMAMLGAIKKGLAGMDQGMSHPHFFDKSYAERLNRELRVIHEKNFEDYFFFVADVVAWAGQRMFVGPGRGSSGGSLLCYLLGITTVDPLKFGTMFERFIDITRPDLPDIDTDFPDTRREEVFQYLKDTYGAERVARLGTISEFGGKSAINDTAKALGIPADVGRALGKFTEGAGQGKVIPPARVFGGEYNDNMILSDEDKELLLRHPEGLLDDAGRQLLAAHPSIRLATVIDGHPRHHGVHAAGVVVTNGPVTQHGALTKEGVIHMDMRAAEDLGLVKMDVLGLRTLSVVQEACDLAGIDPRTLYDLSWDDPKVFDIFNNDRVTGIFQFDGDAVRGLMRGIKVEKFDDICALASLARPGPLIGGAAGTWVKVRRGDEEPRQLHKSLDITFGVICYQEQFMQILRDLAAFDEPSVNGARRAVGKKDPEKLRSYRTQFVTGATKYFAAEGFEKNEDDSGASEKAEELWEEICEFGSYSFNLAHAVAYAMISYMTAHLKAYYPLEFACASLRHAADDETGKNLLRELSEEGYDYVPFDPQRSLSTWSIIDKKLYGGFDSVRGIGEKTAKTLLAARRADPENWLENLTEAQRTRILKEGATPWHDLTYFGTHYADLYRDPSNYRSPMLPKGARPPVLRVKDIPAKKGEYAFLGRITSRSRRDANDPSKVSQRGGKVYADNNWFINLKIEDDTGEIGATINRFKAKDYEWLLEGDKGDLFFRGNIINEGDRKWIFVEKVLEIKPNAKSKQSDSAGSGNAEVARGSDTGSDRARDRDSGQAGGPDTIGAGNGPTGSVGGSEHVADAASTPASKRKRTASPGNRAKQPGNPDAAPKTQRRKGVKK